MVSTVTSTAPSTLLEAVNKLLTAVRLAPIMSLASTDTNVDALSAKKALEDVCREVLTRGYEFNTERDLIISPDAQGNIVLPFNAMKATVSRSEATRYVRRGQKLYDNVKHTYAIGKSVKVDAVVALPFESLPESFKLYVTGMAARRWCLPKLPESPTFQYTSEFVQNALALAEAEDQEMRDDTLASTSPHFANMARR